MRKKIEYLVFILLLIVVVLSYSNHFHNSFHFDDYHTIVNNIYIRDIGNFLNFFTDIRTFGAMPNNLGYRPVVTASTAIDYWMGNGYNTFYFHLSMFLMFLLQGVCMFFLILKIFNISFTHQWTKYLVFFTTGWYMLHPANAETINYIIARSDSFSTFFVVLALVCYIYSSICRRYYLYLIPVALGGLSKETAAMFPVLLFAYILLFENKVSLTKIFGTQRKVFFNTIKKTIPAFIFTLAVALFVQYICYKNTSNSGILHSSVDSYHFRYILTQPYVLFMYFYTFFLPVTLCSDPEFLVFSTNTDIRMYIGFLFVILMFVLAFYTSKKEKTRPIAFGILWFFIAAVPTSILAALTQVSNSHRLLYLYVGLSIAVGWGIFLLLEKMQPVIENKKLSKGVVALGAIILCAYAIGTFQRNKVWENDETLWYDILQKSPENPRAIMNYGLELMKKGDYTNAEKYFLRSIEIWPYFNYAYVNLGILKGATGDPVNAEKYYKKAIELGDNSYPSYYYGKFLYDQNRLSDAIVWLENSIRISPGNLEPRMQLLQAYYKTQDWDKLRTLAEKTLTIVPGDKSVLAYIEAAKNKIAPVEKNEEDLKKSQTPESFIELSLLYYRKGQYDKCIEASLNAIKLRPNFPEAYNNIGSAYNMLKEYDKAITACMKAIELNPGFELAKNNLIAAVTGKNDIGTAEAVCKKLPSADNYINLSHICYQHKQFQKCIDACYKALNYNPNFADAYCNICAAHNQLKQWDKAAAACQKALDINPDHALAKGNLKWATDKKP